MEQHIEFGDGSAACAALAEAFEYFQRIAEDFDLSEIRAAAVVASGPGWARPPRKPPPLRSASWSKILFRRTVKARVCRIGNDIKLHERPRWVGAAHFREEWENDCSDQRRRGHPEG